MIASHVVAQKIESLGCIPNTARSYALLRLKGATHDDAVRELSIPLGKSVRFEEAVQNLLMDNLPTDYFEAYAAYCCEDVPPKKKRVVVRQKKAVPRAALHNIPATIKIEKEFVDALNILENTADNVFLTGRAGTGKSTLLDYFRKTTKKNIVVVAPTGVAAVNVSGQTIHSFFCFGPAVSKESIKKVRGPKAQIFKKLDAIVIDEISMARCDIMDFIDVRMRLNGPHPDRPFGGVQLICVGDLFQLPPVVTPDEKMYFEGFYETPYFFSAKVFRDVPLRLIELHHVWRQTNSDFIDILDKIRTNTISQEYLNVLNSRHNPFFECEEDDFSIFLSTTNASADSYNAHHLALLAGRDFTHTALVSGEFPRSAFPAPHEVRIRKGAQVMLLNNDRQGRWVNGDIGKVVSCDGTCVCVELQNGLVHDVTPHAWDVVHYRWDEDNNSIEAAPVGSFTQIPLRLAWAITIHKGQGKTFEKVIIDFGRGTFATGQAYVALSRCRSLEGVTLLQPFERRHILMDERVVAFMNSLRCRKN